MTASEQPSTRSVEANDFLRAITGQAWDAADGLLHRLEGPHDATLTRGIATLHMRRHRWNEAAETLGRLAATDPAAALHRNLCRNLAALRTHRATVYRCVADAAASDQYRVHRLPTGVYTVARMAGDRPAPLCGDPVGQVQSALSQLKTAISAGEPLAILSLGDGHVLGALAAKPPQLFLGRQQPIFVLEPDPHLLLACLQIHDFTGPLGPIEQDRVLWYVGPTWDDALRLDVMTDRYLPFPKINIKQGGAAPQIEAILVEVLDELGRSDAQAADALRQHYTPLTPGDFARALTGQAKRSPRVLLLTTRFSTVLQYSTRDAEDAFRRLGCETVIVIEPTPHHVLSRSAIRRTLADFKPDLVMQIDHHRFEHGDLFPPALPFVNWIQDLLPHLMTPAAGGKLGATDFVLTPSLQRWVDDFAYPQRQCMEFRKLTRVPGRPPARQTDPRQVVYVSNWSQSPAQITAELLHGTAGMTRTVLAEACARMIGVYADGGSLPSVGDVRRLLERVLADLGASADEALTRDTTTRLFDRLNNLLYRQQGLAWAVDACAALDLRLDIFGNGWASHPRFAPHARGTVEYGPALEDLTRGAAVNLILEPFMSLAHQRLLDALAAGGFCIVRDHSANHTANEWVDLLARAGPDVQTAAALRNVLRGDDVARFDANFAECERLDGSPGRVDHVATVSRMQRSGFLPESGQVLPLLDRVAFTTPQTLLVQLGKAARDTALRAQVAAAQRRRIEERYSYTAGMARVLAFVAGRLAEPALSPAKAA